MKKSYLIYILFIVFVSCNKTQQRNDNRESIILEGVIEDRYRDSVILIRAKEIDTSLNLVLSEGKFYKDLRSGEIFRTGWHNFFDSSGNLIEKNEFFTGLVNNSPKEFISQNIIFDTNGDTIKSKSSYFKLYSNQSDTIILNDTLTMNFNIFHRNNKQKLYGKYKLVRRINEKQTDTLYSNEPTFKLCVVPSEIGEMKLDCQIRFFLQTEYPDSLIPVNMSYRKKYKIL